MVKFLDRFFKQGRDWAHDLDRQITAQVYAKLYYDGQSHEQIKRSLGL